MEKLLVIAIAGIILSGCQKQPAEADAIRPASSTKASVQPTSVQVSAPPKTYDGPFGLAGSMSIAELERMGFKTNSDRPNLYFGNPPKALEDANSYAVLATPTVGVCRIMAHVQVPVVNGSGDQLKDRTDRLAELFQTKYGKYSDKVDYIKQDVYRRNPQYWLMGLKEDSVLYAYDWSAGKTATPLPSNLENIEVAADTTEINSGFVSIKYTFKNFKDCREEMQAVKAQNL